MIEQKGLFGVHNYNMMKNYIQKMMIVCAVLIGVQCLAYAESASTSSSEQSKKINQPFEPEFPYKVTGTIEVNANKKEWVRRVGDKVGGRLLWTPDGKYAVLYLELGGGYQMHYFFCFKDDGTGWMKQCSEHRIQTHYLLKDFSIKGEDISIQLESKRSPKEIDPHIVPIDGSSSKVKIDLKSPNDRKVESHVAGKTRGGHYVNFGDAPIK